MTDQPRASLLGLPPHLDRATARTLSTTLAQTWAATMGAPPSADLSMDLNSCRRWFDPVAQGQRLRRELSALPVLSHQLDDPGAPLTITVSAGKRLVTPEGRCALDLLERLSTEGNYAITDRRLLEYDRILGALYREWTRHRLKSVLDLLAGSTKPLQVPAAGVVIALLVNRCTSQRRSLTRFAGGPARDVVDRAFFAPVQAFSDVLAPRSRGNKSNPQLVSGWMLYEARRRLGDGLVVEDARGGHDGRVWIRPEYQAHTIDIVTRDLARGHRARITRERFGEGFDALVAALRRELPRLAGFGLVHERPPDTKALRETLIQSLDRQLGLA
jgi:hypothetical protein